MKTDAPTFGEIAGQYLQAIRADRTLKPRTLVQYKSQLRSIQRHWPGLAGTPVGKITTRDCDRWHALRKARVGADQLNFELAMLKRVLSLAQRRGIILDNPAESLRHVRVESRPLFIPSRTQFTQVVVILGAFGNHRAVELVELLAYSGMRRAEAAALTWADVDFDGGSFLVTGGEHGTKNGKSRRVPLFPAMRQMLVRLRARRRGINPGDRVLRVRQCKASLARARRVTNLPGFTLHCLRHFFAFTAVRQGISCELIAQWMGHTDGGLQIARLYAGNPQDDPKEMAERMTYTAQARYKGPPSKFRVRFFR